MSAPASTEDELRAPAACDPQPPEQLPPSHTIQIESDRPAAASAPLTGWSFVQSLFSGIITVANELLGVSAPVPAVPACEEEPEREMCPICYARVPSFSAACGHQICIECAVHYVREALRDKTQVYPQGVRCPMHSNGCECFITSTTVFAAACCLLRSFCSLLSRVCLVDPLEMKCCFCWTRILRLPSVHSKRQSTDRAPFHFRKSLLSAFLLESAPREAS
ncbi:hypothetical protein AB1Y20_006548 [Prymnesium parvum]|uniref:RING-type domain-containing protein n=1 Tax=Prymnesium parvum TaxID=97485 RepID=A0AB34IZY9_PRYPA